MTTTLQADVVIIGSGAGGAAVGGELARAGLRVVIVESGPQRFPVIGGHARNFDSTDAALSKYGSLLDEVLVFPSEAAMAPPNLPDLKVIHGVGGMFSFWMCNCPTPHSDELAPWIAADEWHELLARARSLLKVSTNLGAGSGRQNILIERAKRAVPALPPARDVQPMPLAAIRTGSGIRFSAADDLLASGSNSPAITILPNVIATRILHTGHRVQGISAIARVGGAPIEITAEVVIVAAGTVGSAKLIAGSGLNASPALGRYIFDHPALGSRVVLARDILDAGPLDNLTVWIPYSTDHPWHNQICRFPSNPSAIDFDVDPNQTADIFTFAAMAVDPGNRLVFHFDRHDPYGLPEIVGEYRLSALDFRRIADGLAEHFRIACEIGDLTKYHWAPTFFGPGWSTHMMGSCRMGPVDDGTSVVDTTGRLWAYDNLYVAGNALLAVSNAGNPTLMSIAIAMRTADAILRR